MIKWDLQKCFWLTDFKLIPLNFVLYVCILFFSPVFRTSLTLFRIVVSQHTFDCYWEAFFVVIVGWVFWRTLVFNSPLDVTIKSLKLACQDRGQRREEFTAFFFLTAKIWRSVSNLSWKINKTFPECCLGSCVCFFFMRP